MENENQPSDFFGGGDHLDKYNKKDLPKFTTWKSILKFRKFCAIFGGDSQHQRKSQRASISSFTSYLWCKKVPVMLKEKKTKPKTSAALFPSIPQHEPETQRHIEMYDVTFNSQINSDFFLLATFPRSVANKISCLIWRTHPCSNDATFFVTAFFFPFCFLGLHLWHTEIPRLGVESELQLPAIPQPQQHQIQALSVNYATAHGSAGSLTHWARTGIEHTSSWILVRFGTAEPQ